MCLIQERSYKVVFFSYLYKHGLFCHNMQKSKLMSKWITYFQFYNKLNNSFFYAVFFNTSLFFANLAVTTELEETHPPPVDDQNSSLFCDFYNFYFFIWCNYLISGWNKTVFKVFRGWKMIQN